jgi:hypothetical protein
MQGRAFLEAPVQLWQTPCLITSIALPCNCDLVAQIIIQREQQGRDLSTVNHLFLLPRAFYRDRRRSKRAATERCGALHIRPNATGLHQRTQLILRLASTVSITASAAAQSSKAWNDLARSTGGKMLFWPSPNRPRQRQSVIWTTIFDRQTCSGGQLQ